MPAVGLTIYVAEEDMETYSKHKADCNVAARLAFKTKLKELKE